MNDYTVVVNAGSSSLKFCVYRRAESDRGRSKRGDRVEGIGTSPKFSAKDGADKPIGDVALDPDYPRRPGRARLRRELASRPLPRCPRLRRRPSRRPWRRAVRGSDDRDAGGAGGSARADSARASASAVQPGGDRGGVRNGCRACRRSPASTRAFIAASPRWRELVPLPREIRDAGVQRYGFHGLSYEYIASVLPSVAPEIAGGRVIVAHLGSGASLCALKDGKSVDSTLGFTALDGLCMGTRPGALDPGVVLYLFQALGLSAKEVETILYKKSGLLGISGISNDMRDLLASNEPAARLARRLLRLSRRKRNRRDDGGSRRNRRPRVHRRHRRELAGDPQTNLRRVGVARHRARRRRERAESGPRISSPASKVSAWVIPTNEELMIARHTGALLGLGGQTPRRFSRAQGPDPARRSDIWPRRSRTRSQPTVASHPGTDSGRVSGRRRSTFAISSSRTTSRTTATARFSKAPRHGPNTSGTSSSCSSSRSARRASSTCRRYRARLPRTHLATSTRTTRSSSACRPTRRSSARSCRTAACVSSSTR